MTDSATSRWLERPAHPASRIAIVNSGPEFCARQWRPEQIRWGPPGDFALALEAMRANNLAVFETVARTLDEVSEAADLYLLRNWRYSEAELAAFQARFPRARTILDLRILIFEIHARQRLGEFLHFSGLEPPAASGPLRFSSLILSRPTLAWTGASLNTALLAELGLSAANQRSRPHIVPWIPGHEIPAPVIPAKPPVAYDRFRVLFVGRCLYRKGLLRLIEALRMTGIPDYELTAVTPSIRNGTAYDFNERPVTGPAESLIRGALENGRLTVISEAICPEELMALYQRSHLFVCPSVADNGPNTVIESMALGTPLIVSDMSGAMEQVPSEFRRVWQAPRWWRGESRPKCGMRLAEAIQACYEEQFTTRRVREYGSELQQAFLRAGWLERLWAEYSFVFAELSACSL